MTAAERKANARAKIDATKELTLDQRIDVLRDVLTECGVIIGETLNTTVQRKVAKALESRGFLPMMFAHAYRVLVSESR